MTRIAVIGCGYWGPKLARNLEAIDGVRVTALCDTNPARLIALGRFHPSARLVGDAEEVLAAPDVDAVAIATPVETHHRLAAAALARGKHVMVEKPLANSVADAAALVAQAREAGLTLLVDHTFIYSGAVRKLRALVESGEIGDLLYIDSVRINLGLFQPDVNVLWDLAPHDVSIVTHLVRATPLWVSAVGRAHYGRHECQAYVTIQFADSVLAHMHVNWLAPVKIRSTLVGGSKRMIVYDDLEPSEKIRIYEKGVSFGDNGDGRTRALVDYRTGDMHAPYVDKTEPLLAACTDFVTAIRTGAPPVVDGQAGLEVVRILAGAQESLRRGGERIPLAHR